MVKKSKVGKCKFFYPPFGHSGHADSLSLRRRAVAQNILSLFGVLSAMTYVRGQFALRRKRGHGKAFVSLPVINAIAN